MAGAVAALILAGKRDGQLDPLAAAAGVTHKCLVPVAGKPMLLHVIEALAAAPEIGRILVSIDAPDALMASLSRIDAGRIEIVQSRTNLVDSILAAADAASPPLFITTADNVLLTPASVAEIIRDSHDGGASVAFARRGAVLAAHPDGQRRFYKFRDDEYSNCNSYFIGCNEALKAAEVFRGGGQFAKFPARILKAFGLWNLIRFRLGLASLDGAFAGFSKRFGFGLNPVIVSDGALAIDVDNARTKAIAEELLLARATRSIAAPIAA